jgi:hypothetical protein
LGTVFAEYEILKGLQLKVSLGTDIYDTKETSYIPSSIYEGSVTAGQAAIGVLNSTSWLNENTLTYSKKLENIFERIRRVYPTGV